MVDPKEIKVKDIKSGKDGYEPRKIVIAQGIQSHDDDIAKLKSNPKLKKIKYLMPVLDYLKERIEKKNKKEKKPNTLEIEEKNGAFEGFESVQKIGKYRSESQKVDFTLITIVNKKDFHRALETEGIHVIYGGHARYGQGACFHTYSGTIYDFDSKDKLADVPAARGDQWEDGTSEDNGIFRMGYPYVPVGINDIKKCKYHFRPVPVEDEIPPTEKADPFSRHPDARRKLEKIKLDEDLREFVELYPSASDTYYGVTLHGEKHLLLRAGWENTVKYPYDLGATQLKCKVFCHFGCSSRKHFWDIVRKSEYKGWTRPEPPTDKYAYFTTEPSHSNVCRYWLYHVLTYDPGKEKNEPDKDKSWWESLQYAKKKANADLSSDGDLVRIY